MRIGFLPFIVVVATVAAASPIRLIITTHTDAVPGDAPTALRFGHALENNNVPAMKVNKYKMDCGDMRHMNKAVENSNSLRKMFGFPEIQHLEMPHAPFLPVHPIPPAPPALPLAPATLEQLEFFSVVHTSEQPSSDVQAGAPHGHTHMHHPHSHDHGSFLHRIHRSLMALGTWEARVVAFVLGCGIGVLLRMFWVIMVVGYRTVRGDRFEDDDDDAQYALIYEDPEEIAVAPPQYIVIDEKAPIVDNGDVKADGA